MKCHKIIAISAMLAAACAVAFAQTASEPKSIELTVYNGNFALVRDVRSIDLVEGINSLEVENVAALIDPTSVLFKSLTAPDRIAVLEQNYQYDLISPENILNKSVGHEITYTRYYDNTQSTVSGTILNPPSNGGIVIKTADGKLILNPGGEASLTRMPDGLRPKPTLTWLLRSAASGRQDTQISYITNGVGWRADYVVLVNKDDTGLDLNGWVTLNNNSGATYKDAKLTLMAGDVRRVEDARRMMPMAAKAAQEFGRADEFEEKSFFEYHLYKLGRPTTISNNETKQLSLLNASDVAVQKEMTYDPRGNWWRNWWYPGRSDYDPGAGWDTSDYHKINVTLQIKNSKENHMGMPLPAGKIRVYKTDDDGSQQFIGEDNIDHTPKDELIRLYVGDAFDIVGDYKRTDYQKISNRVHEETFEVKIRNHKETPVTVRVVEHAGGDWKITASSLGYNKKDATTLEFPVKVPADGETVATYTIRTTW